jgi:peptidoglycan/xylan/chitin deacetylase (PgdA/CDA1 family)
MIKILAFHSIGIENSAWTQRYLSSPLDHFEEFCKYLHDNKYETISLDEWYELNNVKDSNSENKIVITFDDGYLDNWVYVFPILKKYNIKITIFVNPEFVDPRDEIRPTLEDAWSDLLSESDLQPIGFLNWKEMNIMEDSGLVDIQSHSMTHNTYFKNDKLIDLYEGAQQYDWLPWIYDKKNKPYYMLNPQMESIQHGTPIFDYDRSLAIKKYLPSQEFMDYCIEEYRRCSEPAKEKKALLNKIIQSIIGENNIGRYETDAEYIQRFNYELVESRRIIEEKLKKEVRYLCWPGGRYNKLSLLMSIDTGYKASTTTTKSEGRNVYSENNYKRMRRIGMGSKINSSRTLLLQKTNKGLVYCYKEYTGNIFQRIGLKNKRRFLQLIY